MRVLVVDDDVDSRHILRKVFENAGHTVLEAGMGTEVLPLATEHSPDVVLMDMRVPGMDGWEATHALKAAPATSHIPVIAVSAHALPVHRARAQAVGCSGYISKPVDPKVVVEQAEQIVRSLAVDPAGTGGSAAAS